MTQQATGTVTRPKTLNDLLREIVQKGKLEEHAWTAPFKAVWWAGPWSNSGLLDVRQGESFALNPGYLVFSIFDDGDEIKVFVLQGAGTPAKGADGKPVDLPPALYRLKAGSPTYSATPMSMPMWEDAIIDCIWELVEAERPGTYDEVECPACGIEVPELPFCGSCGAKLEEDEDAAKVAQKVTIASVPGAGVPAAAAGAVPPSAVPTTPAPPSTPAG